MTALLSLRGVHAHYGHIEALKGIDLDVHAGEIVTLIGANGAGKSTLLKIIAGTLQPSAGSVEVAGRVAAILELGTGFNPNYSGRENVIMSGMLRGMTETEIRRKFDSIVAFSGLEGVIDQPFHTYSSGMQARLAFATAISVEADVIIIDEALAAGDVRFASKSLRRIREISQSGVTCLFVSHVTYQIMQLCTRAIWIDKGVVRMDGPAIEVVRAYEYEMHRLIAEDRGEMALPPAAHEAAAEAPAIDDFAPDEAPVTEAAHVAETGLAPAKEIAPTELEALDGASAKAELEGPEQPELAAAAPRAEPAAAPAPARADAPSEDSAPKQAAEAPMALAPAAAAADNPLQPGMQPSRHSTGKYRITSIEFLDRHDNETMTFRFGEVFRIRVGYERLVAEEPDASCGLAVTFNRVSDFETVMDFNTVYPHSDAEIIDYDERPSRRCRGASGVIEARIDPLQLCAGEFYVSLGILPNDATHREFYEYLHCQFRVTVLPNGFQEPSVFYPIVEWTHGPAEPASRARPR